MKQLNQQKGFTMVEFMISMAVFSLILIVILAAVAQVSKLYSKGITTTRTQQTARSLIDTIAQQIQYGEAVPSFAGGSTAGFIGDTDGKSGAMCVSGKRLSFVINRQVDTGSVNTLLNTQKHALWYDPSPSGACTSVAGLDTNPSPSAAGSELLPEGMRLLYLEITPVQNTVPVASIWKVKLKVGFGGQDLYEDNIDPTREQKVIPINSVCKGAQTGTQFCAVSQLETLVQRRVQ